MAKKLKKKVQRKPAARKVENPVVDSARDIWLAGLGAFSVAQQEGEKFIEEGNKFFEKLVKEGSKVEKKTRKDVEGAFDDIRGELESRVKDFRGEVETRVKDIRGEVESRVKDFGGDFDSRLDPIRDQAESVRKQANSNWDKLETIFDERVARVLSRLGIPTSDDVAKLNRRVQDLARRLATIEKSKKAPRAAAKPAPKKAAPRKAVKKPVARKAAPKKAAPRKAAVKKAAPKAAPKPASPAAPPAS